MRVSVQALRMKFRSVFVVTAPGLLHLEAPCSKRRYVPLSFLRQDHHDITESKIAPLKFCMLSCGTILSDQVLLFE